jgi:hypothetical protein
MPAAKHCAMTIHKKYGEDIEIAPDDFKVCGIHMKNQHAVKDSSLHYLCGICTKREIPPGELIETLITIPGAEEHMDERVPWWKDGSFRYTCNQSCLIDNGPSPYMLAIKVRSLSGDVKTVAFLVEENGALLGKLKDVASGKDHVLGTYALRDAFNKSPVITEKCDHIEISDMPKWTYHTTQQKDGSILLNLCKSNDKVHTFKIHSSGVITTE